MVESFEIDLRDFKYEFEQELNYLREYFSFNFEKLNERKAKLDHCLKLDILESPTLEESLKNMYYHDYVKVPSYFYHSSIVSIYSLLETRLNGLCNKIQTDTELVIGLVDLSGANLIQKSRIFLSKFAEINFNIIDKEWIRITDFQKLRNLIVHQNSEIKAVSLSESAHVKVIEKFKGINFSVAESKFYITDIDVLYEFLDVVEEFMSQMIKQISNRRFEKFQKVYRLDSFFGVTGSDDDDFDYDDLPF